MSVEIVQRFPFGDDLDMRRVNSNKSIPKPEFSSTIPSILDGIPRNLNG